MNSKLRVALISAGMISNMAHIPAYRSLDKKVEIVGVCDTNMRVAQETAKRHNIPKWYGDAQKMLEELKPDLVSVCTPNASHKAMVALALEYSSVACEKPLALTYKDTKELFDIAKDNGKKLFACQTMRFGAEYFVAKEFFDSGQLGDVYYSEFSCIRRRGIPKWGTFHRMDANGGGCLCDLGVHMFDALLWVIGNPQVISVSGNMSSYIGSTEKDIITSLSESGAPSGVHSARPFSPEEFEVEEFAAGTVRLAGGASINFKTAWAVNLPPQFEISLAGTKAGLSLPMMELYSTVGRYQADIKPRVFRDGPHDNKDFSGHYYLFENAVNHLLGEGELIIRPEQTLSIASIIDAFYISAREGREVRVEEVVK